MYYNYQTNFTTTKLQVLFQYVLRLHNQQLCESNIGRGYIVYSHFKRNWLYKLPVACLRTLGYKLKKKSSDNRTAPIMYFILLHSKLFFLLRFIYSSILVKRNFQLISCQKKNRLLKNFSSFKFL